MSTMVTAHSPEAQYDILAEVKDVYAGALLRQHWAGDKSAMDKIIAVDAEVRDVDVHSSAAIIALTEDIHQRRLALLAQG